MQSTLARGRHAETIRINDYLWRVTAPDGFVFGHVERVPTPEGDRYESKRYQLAAARFVSVGRFWNFTDAVGSLRHG
ncbi:hypothetical protein [Paramicrobacterium chengjingii]|uniref:Uncharacterized protein n=1 Tax=Paramicrobacterium chengjingii TaxID=2769067 RepID=A0ABX6YF82_9MICO|nr:hypothetical protein [Microbacterium chengjingii]QPZ37065.1 hypothetical protein HCR76_09240 [Microbacterium chengjingii]